MKAKSEDLRNIYYNKKYGSYYLQKRIHGTIYYGGCCKTLEEAVERRDYLNQHGWENVKKGESTRLKVKEKVAKMFRMNVEDIP